MYDDELAPVGAGAAAFAVRNIAATPPVRVTLDGEVVADAMLAPQQEVTAVLPATTYWPCCRLPMILRFAPRRACRR